MPHSSVGLRRRPLGTFLIAASLAAGALLPQAAAAQERLCDPSFENCRVPLRDLIAAEQVGIDVAFWFMTDPRYTTDLIQKHNQGVPIRVIVDTRANSEYPDNALRLKELTDAGIPIRRRTASGILHWKMMLFAGQGTVQFSAANYSSQAFTPREPYLNYTDEAVYFTDDQPVVNSFMTKFDDLWTNTSSYANYANVSGSLQRHYSTFTKDPELNFPPAESFRSRSVSRYNAETVQIDATMFRITDRAHTDALIKAMGRGVRVRLITDYGQYTNPDRLWHSWNVDRLYMAGAEIRWAGERTSRSSGPSIVGHMGTVHQKSVQLYGQRLTIFGSSNWTSPSSSSQEEHNYFTTKGWIWTWFREQFERKWSNATGNVETVPFAPMPPDVPSPRAPASGATGLPTTVTLEWHGGPWAHVYDIYFGTSSNPPLFAANQELGPSLSSSQRQTFTLSGLTEGTTYYWRIIGKTMANMTAVGAVRSFTTAGTPTGGGDPPVSAPWSTQDIGAVGVPGAATQSGGTFTLDGSGADIWGSADAFRFVYQPLTGDGEIVARVATLQNTHEWAKAGVMLRESTSAGSRHALMLVSAGRGLAFQRRTSTGGSSTHTDGGSGVAPQWVRLVRRGNVFEAYRSSNGSSWSLVGSQSIAMGSTILAGLAVTSHNNGVTARAAFDGVLVSTQPGGSGGTLPSGWGNGDIGSVGVAGSAAESGGTYTVRGSGADIWGSADAFHFASRPLTGDGEIVARVATLQNTNDWAKAGVMIRESMAAGARNAFVAVTATRGVIFQRRVSTGGSSAHTNSGSGTAPEWVRLVRRGNLFEAYRSSNGSTWTPIGSATITMGSTVYAGLAVTSHNNAVVATATFDNVLVSTESGGSVGTLPSGWGNGDIGSVGVAGSAAESDGTYTVRGSGADIWGSADAFHFASRPLSGDGEIVARVATLQNTDDWAKAGVMIRESMAAGSRNAFVAVTATRGVIFQLRVSTGSSSTHTNSGSGTAPEWVRLVREGDLFEAYRSSNGSSWTLIGSATITMDSSVYTGLAVTSHNNAVVATATFDNVAVN